MGAERTPDVSVVVPTRNRSRLLRHTLATILGQRDVAVEVIVVDEASTDDTPRLLAEMADERVRVIRNEQPVGVSAARNLGTRIGADGPNNGGRIPNDRAANCGGRFMNCKWCQIPAFHAPNGNPLGGYY